MTREEIINLLNDLIKAYPYYAKKITDPKGTADIWEREFGPEDAEKIYKAARYWENHSPFFPTVADIRKSINKGQMMFSNTELKKQPPVITAETVKIIDPNARTGCDICPIADVGACKRTQQEYDNCTF